MKVIETNLNDYLKRSLDSIYVILGNEYLLIDESLEKIYTKAKEQNFTEKETHIVNSRTSWDFLSSNSENLDLFGSKKIIEVKLLDTGPGIKGANALKEYAKKPNTNILLVVIVEIEKRERKKYLNSAWVRALEKTGILIPISSLSLSSVVFWITNKGKALNVEITKEAGKLLAEKTEGNLMATLQEIRRLSLIYPSQQIDLEKMRKGISNSSKYDVFDFSNAFISRNTKKAIIVLESLKAEGTPEVLVVWALARELNKLFKESKSGSDNKHRILKAFKKIAIIDSCIKGLDKQNPWLAIRELTLTF